MAAIPPNPDMLILAREVRGLTQHELSKQLGTSQGTLSKIESGARELDPELLRRVARTLDFPESFFFAREPVYGPATSDFFHRRRQRVSAKQLGRIHAMVNIRRMHVSRLLRSVDLAARREMPRLHVDDFEGGASEVARAVRAAWELPKGPLRNLTEAVEDAGAIVSLCSFGTNLVDEVSVWPPDLPPLFFLNSAFPADRRRLTLAHALGHIVMHDAPNPDMERQANEFAAELLMPAADIHASLESPTLERLAALKPFWKVSMGALLVRARDLGQVTERRYRDLWMQMGRAGYRTKEPPELEFPPEEPATLLEALEFHMGEMGYGMRELADLLAVHPHHLTSVYGVQSPETEGPGPLRLLRPRPEQ